MVMDAVFSLPAVLGVALFIGVVALVKLLLSPDGAFERRLCRDDRRKIDSIQEFPFYDSDRELVTDDRRTSTNRRSHKFIITIQKSPTSH